ncbi:hypothetical protein [Viridibacillus sp. FSL H8-0123]|uniref:hypothetical protein n=1 Tax=Viridibacillus sp. FSL H8-0123 TaxID=1928922 RepID=UPI00096E779B|nr:hypothetical protein [Viridibacillus sp. FSL H8-0123]OMC84012.1 hypothetical protein BK130_05790 [Viridibacillus sp. FSL H8-0123]
MQLKNYFHFEQCLLYLFGIALSFFTINCLQQPTTLILTKFLSFILFFISYLYWIRFLGIRNRIDIMLLEGNKFLKSKTTINREGHIYRRIQGLTNGGTTLMLGILLLHPALYYNKAFFVAGIFLFSMAVITQMKIWR